MTRGTNKKQGQSIVTPDKQDKLYHVLTKHISICQNIYKQHHWASPIYQYIDMNAGSGYNEIAQCDGSPVIFLNCARRKNIKYNAQFVEKDAQLALDLRCMIGQSSSHQVHTGDNKDIVPSLIRKIPRNSYGLVYTDPNGIPDFSLLERISEDPLLARVDILIRYSGTAVKRNEDQTKKKFLDYLGMINKRHWIISEIAAGDIHQFSFLLGLNWDGFSAMKSHGFYKLKSKAGQEIVKKLLFTRDELKKVRQQHLTGLMPSTYATQPIELYMPRR